MVGFDVEAGAVVMDVNLGQYWRKMIQQEWANEVGALWRVGQEKPGILDEAGRIRDLSEHVGDITGSVLTNTGLATGAELRSEDLPLVSGTLDRAMRQGRWKSWPLVEL